MPCVWLKYYSVNGSSRTSDTQSIVSIHFSGPFPYHFSWHLRGCTTTIKGLIHKPRGQNFGYFWPPPPFVVTFTKQNLCYKMVIWLTPPPPSTVHVVYEWPQREVVSPQKTNLATGHQMESSSLDKVHFVWRKGHHLLIDMTFVLFLGNHYFDRVGKWATPDKFLLKKSIYRMTEWQIKVW